MNIISVLEVIIIYWNDRQVLCNIINFISFSRLKIQKIANFKRSNLFHAINSNIDTKNKKLYFIIFERILNVFMKLYFLTSSP
jgi:hypothetical protein